MKSDIAWLFQTKGVINRYNTDTCKGTQPIRVVQYMIPHMFVNTNPEFPKELNELIQEGKLNAEISYEYGEVPLKIGNGKLRTPRINFETKQIEIHESFLSYLWCSVYSIFVRYIETVDYPRCNKINGETTYSINPENIQKADDLFSYAKSLIIYFDTWDKELLPNPEIYMAEDRNYVEQTNIYFTEAMKFILCHEFTHVKYHIEQINNNTAYSKFMDFEFEADNNAVSLTRKGFFKTGIFAEGQNLAIENGIVFGILSMFFFKAKTDGIKHPNAEDRLTNALERLCIPDNHPAWGIACVGLQMWSEQFGLNLNCDISNSENKDQFYSIIEQIKKLAL